MDDRRPQSDPADKKRRGPTAADERITSLDVVRGVAVLGILVVNIHVFRAIPLRDLLEGQSVPGRSSLDAGIELVTGALATGTFLGLFSLLFGIGLAIQLRKSGGGRFGSRRLLVCQRMFWLFLIGYAHLQIASVDVLMPYAVAGIAVVLAAGPTLPPGRIWRRILGATGLFLLIAGLVVANADGWLIAESLFDKRPDHARAILTEGTILERLEVRTLEALSYHNWLYYLRIAGWILVGLWLGLSPILKRLSGPARPLWRIGAAAIISGVALRLGMGIFAQEAGLWIAPDNLGGAMDVIGSILLVIGVGATVAAISIRARRLGRPLRRLACIGRMALTAYLLQSVMVVTVFWLFVDRQQVDATNSLFIVACVWTFLLVFCPWWMSRFQFGPVEWLWRSMTYLRCQPFGADQGPPQRRRDPSISSDADEDL